MELYKKLNNIMGWAMFLIAGIVYTLTLEPTASFWDCGEFISSAYKLEVGHPPGNPIFMLTGRFFANFASDPSQVAWCINFMSAMFSAATILLLFWTITALARKIVIKGDNYSLTNTIAIMGAGAVGALAYTFSDTFWFSAVEGEVYAYSSFCTALVVWLILKWENHADEPHANRYIILIAYIIGISIAVHLLNLLCIPAIVLIYYYKKWKEPSAKGSIIAILVSFALIFFILYGLVPGFIKVAGWAELLFVNVFGAPYNTGVIAYFFLVIASICWGLYETFTQKNLNRLKLSFIVSLIMVGLPFVSESILLSLLIVAALIVVTFASKKVNIRLLNTVLTCIMVIFIGYSSYAIILLRSTANTPMDQNSPEDVFALSSYLNREQYGERPLLYGYTYTSDIVRDANGNPEVKEGKAIWKRTIKKNENEPDKYVVTDHKKDYTYQPELNMLFPRMYSNQSHHVEAYKEWSKDGNKTNKVKVKTNSGIRYVDKPTFAENIRFFLSYQVNYMYWRYFMWNFAGRQNDIQGHGELHKGNWITGFSFIDKHIEGENLPSDLMNNKGRNVYYMLPLLLGLIGLFYQAFSGQKGIESFWVTFFLFFMTGLAIVIYLNQTPYQPRERDYAYAGSFYAFAIWIGMGVLGIYSIIKKYLLKDRDNSVVALATAILCLFVPVQMAAQNWDDHDRSGRYAARDFGKNYLSCVEENGIIFTNGDNDTFPLWYVQETEGYRTDVRVCNLSYLQTDWYIDQMKSQAYESTPLPIEMDRSRYGNGKLSYAYVLDRGYGYDMELDKAMNYLMSEDKDNKYIPEYGISIDHIPNSNLYIDVDSAAVADKIPADLKGYATDRIDIELANNDALMLNQLSVLSMLNSIAKDNWERPIYYAVTVGPDMYLNLDKHFVKVGLAYRILPVLNNDTESDGLVDTETMYDNMMNKFEWGGVDNPNVYLDETVRKMTYTMRMLFIDLAEALIMEEKYDMALNVLDKMMEKIPASATKHDYLSIQPAMAYYSLGETEKGKALLTEIADNSMEYMSWFRSLEYNKLRSISQEYLRQEYTLKTIIQFFIQQGDEESAEKYLYALSDLGYNLFKES
ncbi:MAG: DUF2723 domain-containing protein [Bacteroidaceae bacterium]|nr:DUF2723 domain-containing protein [Bacteroidaceae bacterium]